MTFYRNMSGFALWTMLAIAGSSTGCHGEEASSQTAITSAGSGGTAQTSTSAGGASSTSAGGVSFATGGASTALGGMSSSKGGSSSAATNTGAPSSHLGQVIISNLRQSGRSGTAEAYPLFRLNAPTCQYQTYGDCSYAPATSTCSDLTSGVVSAGTVTITSSTSISPIDVTIPPNSDGSYTQTALNTFFVGHEQVHLAASGATVPAFSTDVTAPLVLLVNSPSYDASGVITASIQKDLVITFSRGTAGVTMDVLATNTNGTLNCSVDSQKGQLTVPAAALAAFGAGNQFSILTSSITSIPVADSWSIAVGVIMDAMNPDRTQPISVQLQ